MTQMTIHLIANSHLQAYFGAHSNTTYNIDEVSQRLVGSEIKSEREQLIEQFSAFLHVYWREFKFKFQISCR